MALLNKKRKKWVLSLTCFFTALILIVIGTYFNCKDIDIQDNYVKLVKEIFVFLEWLLGFICAGYGLKLFKGGK
jgi:hypothetical protein